MLGIFSNAYHAPLMGPHRRCGKFDPWQDEPFHECEWDDRVKKGGKFDTSGIGDVKAS